VARRSDQRRAAVVALYQSDVTSRSAGDLLGRDASAFTRELVEGTEAERRELDELISRHSTGWSLDRIAPLERSILRVAVHEMRSRGDVPVEVAIDEAVEAAKELCGADAPGFINGVLGAVQRENGAPA
jgi:transcription antitermination protein NusB